MDKRIKIINQENKVVIATKKQRLKYNMKIILVLLIQIILFKQL